MIDLSSDGASVSVDLGTLTNLSLWAGEKIMEGLDVDFEALWAAIRSGQWPIVTATIVIVTVYLARRFLGEWVPWFRSDRGGVILAFATAFLGGIASGLASGSWPDGKTLMLALSTAFAAMGAWSGIKKLIAGK